MDDDHAEQEEIVVGRDALVCFKATGGYEWRLWASLEAAGIVTRRLPPAQVKSFGRSRGTMAATDRSDAEGVRQTRDRFGHADNVDINLGPVNTRILLGSALK